jgi:4-amino-4-deoxy-L-arabinose transferase-like glycosyltransferase
MKRPGKQRRTVPAWAVLATALAAVVAAHAGLLRLPYYWDEAGYYVPAALDFFRTGALIPYSTLANGHPPLLSIYLAVWWKVLGFAPWVTRTAMGALAALALTAVWRLAVIATGKQTVAAVTVLLTALYPVWFAQSTLAHADLAAAAGTLWALAFFLDDRKGWAAVCFALAALAKETAVVTPLALIPLLLFEKRETNEPGPAHSRWSGVAALAAPVVPLAAWYGYVWRKTGHIFGNPEYVRYNATATLTPLRVALALAHRVMHLTLHMNLFVPVLMAMACLLLPPVEEGAETPSPNTGQMADASHVSPLRARIPWRTQAVFCVAIAANAVFFSVLGGALLTRYLLPLYPLVLLLCVNTFRRRLKEWTGLAALAAAGFVAALFINPPYRFAPEDNLEYATVIRLHQAAVGEIVARWPGARVLTAWPATDELTKPELGYVQAPVPVVAIGNFSAAEIARARELPQDYGAVLAFSTKYDPPRLLFDLGRKNEQFDTRYFDFHRDLPPGLIARLLGGQVVWGEERKGQWVAVLRMGSNTERRAQDPQPGEPERARSSATPPDSR